MCEFKENPSKTEASQRSGLSLQGMNGNPLLRIPRDGDKDFEIIGSKEVPLRQATD
jgi:hypothetical protein